METVSMNYTSSFDGVDTQAHAATRTEWLNLDTIANMFSQFLRTAGFLYVENVEIHTKNGDSVLSNF